MSNPEPVPAKTDDNGKSNGKNKDNGKNEGNDDAVTAAENHRDGALLLHADISRNQKRSTALATGFDHNYEAAEDAEDNYQEVASSVGDDLRNEAYAQLRNPGHLGSQSRQIDTSELTGFASAHAVAHAADVFGHPLQRTIATMAKLEADDKLEQERSHYVPENDKN